MPDLATLDPLLSSAREAPMALRAIVFGLGGLLLVTGARAYEWALFGSAGALGMVGGAALVMLANELVPGAATPIALGVGGLAGGALLFGIAKATHRAALVGVGALVGGAAGGAVGALLGGVWWAPLAGLGIGAIALPLLFPLVLKIVTPAVGAVAVGWSVGQPESLWLLGLLWFAGAAVQLGLVKTREREPEAD